MMIITPEGNRPATKAEVVKHLVTDNTLLHPEYVVEKQPDGRYKIVNRAGAVTTNDIEDLEMAERECSLLNKEEDTMAETAAETGTRDGIIYEMLQWAQFEDGSVFNSLRTTINPTPTFTAQEIVDGLFVIHSDNPDGEKLGNIVMKDVIRNAKAALKDGTTKNLAPRV
jgi:hypothetical protein